MNLIYVNGILHQVKNIRKRISNTFPGHAFVCEYKINIYIINLLHAISVKSDDIIVFFYDGYLIKAKITDNVAWWHLAADMEPTFGFYVEEVNRSPLFDEVEYDRLG